MFWLARNVKKTVVRRCLIICTKDHTTCNCGTQIKTFNMMGTCSTSGECKEIRRVYWESLKEEDHL
jgi:hypothetical protein